MVSLAVPEVARFAGREAVPEGHFRQPAKKVSDRLSRIRNRAWLAVFQREDGERRCGIGHEQTPPRLALLATVLAVVIELVCTPCAAGHVEHWEGPLVRRQPSNALTDRAVTVVNTRLLQGVDHETGRVAVGFG